MNRLRIFALAGLGLLGMSFGSAQAAGWHRTYYQPVCRPPVVACSAAPYAVVYPPVTYVPGPLAYYQQARFDERPVVRFGCR